MSVFVQGHVTLSTCLQQCVIATYAVDNIMLSLAKLF